MNYKKLYDSIIENAKLRGNNKKKLPYYTERHHIIPKCVGGTEDRTNKVLLTYREHLTIHHLIWKHYRKEFKINPSEDNRKLLSKMVCAYKMMRRLFGERTEQNLTLKQYELLREEFCKSMTGSGNGFYGRKHTKESKEKMSEKKRGENHPRFGLHGKENPLFGRVGENNPRFGMTHSEESKEKMSLARRGRFTGENHAFSKKCIVFGHEFQCQRDAIKFCKEKFNLKLWQILRNFNDENNKDYIKLK